MLYATDLDVPICEGTFPVQDRLVEALAEEFGATIESPIPFALVTPDELEDACDRENLLGCYTRGRAYSARVYHPHELVHAVADAAGWDGPSPFAEGLAEVYSDTAWQGVERLPIADALRSFETTRDHYYTMSLFVRFLLDRHDIEALGSFMAATRSDDPFDDFAAAFAEHFGEPLEAAMEAFEGAPTCSTWTNRVPLVECAQPEIPWEGSVWTAEVDLACSSDEVIGPLDDDDGPLMAANRTLVIDEDIDVVATVDYADSGLAGVRITRCGPCWDPVDLQLGAGSERSVSLPAGRYYLWFIAEADTAGAMRLSLSR
ncbi:MAG: hypothetical protein H6711_04885 [Myxococcales bacterium]|nr:hypothetical protein [Myxococcales bacterium]